MTDLTAAEVFRDYATDGVPASGAYQPKKNEVRSFLTTLENNVSAVMYNAGLVYSSRALLYSDLSPAANTRAEVRNDATLSYNGIYAKVGGEDVGSWTRISDLPDDIVNLSVTGGTGNAITAVASPQLPITRGNKLYKIVPDAANTGATTLTVSGWSVAPIKTVLGADLPAGSLAIGKPELLVWSTDHFRMISATAVDASGILAAAEAAQAAAEDAAADATAAGNSIHADAAAAEAATIPGGAKGFHTLFADAAHQDRLGGAWYGVVASEPTHEGKLDLADTRWGDIAEPVLSPIMAPFGAVPSGSDATAAINDCIATASAKGLRRVDCYGLPLNVIGPIEMAEDIEMVGINFQVVTNSSDFQNVILVASGCRLQGVITGTGDTGRVERGIYPIADGVKDVTLDMTIGGLTYGVHAAPLADPFAEEDMPSGWKVDLRFRNIIGPGLSEDAGGYGLLGIFKGFQGFIYGDDIHRALTYLSSGARDNKLVITGNDHKGSCVVMSTAIDPPRDLDRVKDNVIHVNARGFTDTGQGGTGVGVNMDRGCDDNEIHVHMVGGTDAVAAVSVSGVGTTTDAHPTGNEFYVHAVGAFSGDAVVTIFNGNANRIINPYIDATVGTGKSLIQVGDSGGNEAPVDLQCEVKGGFLNGNDVTDVVGIRIGNDHGWTDVHGGTRFAGFAAGNKVIDSSGQRSGLRSRSITVSKNFGSVSDSTTSTQTVDIGETMDNAKIKAGIEALGSDTSHAAVFPTTLVDTTLTLKARNDSGGALTIVGWAQVDGD